MAIIRVTKKFTFEMAHALWNYDGSCRNIHGHSYKLYVTVSGVPINDDDDPKNGMVLDFGDIKNLVRHTIINEFDHALMISENVDIDFFKRSKIVTKLKVMKFQPTCENLLIYIAEILREELPEQVKLFSLKLRETNSSYAEWYAEDNS